MQIPPDKAQLLDMTGISGNIWAFGHVFSPNPRCLWCCQFNGRPDLLLSDDLCQYCPVSIQIPILFYLTLTHQSSIAYLSHIGTVLKVTIRDTFSISCIKPMYSVLGMKVPSHPTRKSLKTGGHPVLWPWCLTTTSVRWPSCTLMG